MTHPSPTLVPGPNGVLPFLGEQKGQRVALSGDYLAQPTDFEADGISAYWSAWKRHKLAFFGLVFLGVVGGIVSVFPEEVTYRSKATIEIQGVNQSFMNLSQVDPGSADNYSTSASNIQTQIEILQSASVRDKALSRLKQEPMPPSLDAPTVLSRIEKRLKILSKTPASAKVAIQKANASLRVVPIKGTRVIEISSESTSPEIAARFLNLLSEEYIQQNLDDRLQSAERTTKWLADRLESVKSKLAASEDTLQRYAREAGLNGSNEDGTLASAKLKQIEADLSGAQTDRIKKQSRYELARHLPLEAFPANLDDGSLRTYLAKITELREQRAQLTAALTPTNPKVQRITAQIAELDEAAEKERLNLVGRLKNELSEAVGRESLLSRSYAEESKLAAGDDDRAVEYNIRKREVEINRELYRALLQQSSQAGMASAMLTNNVRLIDSARPSTRAVRPKPGLNLGLGFFTGILLGGVFVFVRNQADRTVRDPAQVLGPSVPVLGSIPSAPSVRKVSTGSRMKDKLFARGTLRLNESQATLPVRVELATWQQRPSILAESFRSCLGTLIFPDERGRHPQVVCVSSPGEGEGKTTVSSNLALAIAETGRRVLLIDGDVRKPRLNDIFNVANTWGLSDLIFDSMAIDGYPSESLVRATPVPNVYLLASGPVNRSLNSFMYSARLPQLIARLRGEFHTILIDTPPITPFADARLLSRQADGIIMVVRCGVTQRAELRNALQGLQDDHIRLLGTISNDWTPTRRQMNYYRHYEELQ